MGTYDFEQEKIAYNGMEGLLFIFFGVFVCLVARVIGKVIKVNKGKVVFILIIGQFATFVAGGIIFTIFFLFMIVSYPR